MKENRVLTIDNLTTTFESHKQKVSPSMWMKEIFWPL